MPNSSQDSAGEHSEVGSRCDDPGKAIHAVQSALEQCVGAITAEWLSEREPLEVLASVGQIRKGLEAQVQSLGALMPCLLEHARASASVSGSVERVQASLKAQEEEIAQIERALAPLAERERTVKDRAAERDRLKSRLDELKRMEVMADGMDELQQQVAALERRLESKAGKAKILEENIREKSESLVRVSSELLGTLKARVRKSLEAADQNEKELRGVAVELEEAKQRHWKGEEELRKRERALECYKEADRVVARAFPDAASVDEALDEVERLLREADNALKEVMKANAEASELTRIGMSGDSQ